MGVNPMIGQCPTGFQAFPNMGNGMTADLDFLHQPQLSSCLELVRQVASTHPHEPALECDGLHQSHHELHCAVEATRQWLVDQGLPPGCRTLVLLPNVPEQIWLQLALLGLGAHSALVDVKSSREALAQIAQEALPAVLICSGEGQELCSALLPHLPPRTRILTVDGLRERALGAPEPARLAPLSTDGRLLYFRKDREDHWRGASFGLDQLGATAQQVRQLFSLHVGSTVLCHMSVSHYLAFSSMVMPALCAGGCLLLADRNATEEELLDLIQQHSPRLMVHYRTFYWHLLKAAQARQASGRPVGQVLHALVNAESPQLPFQKEWETLFHGNLLAGFATTWAGAFLSLDLPWLERRENFVGMALPGVDLRVLDETGQERPAGRWGEVIFQSPGMAYDFTQDWHASLELTEEGWLRSQQMAMLDAEGYLTLADEVFDVIWLHGFKVSPLEIEEPLIALPGVLDVAALGAPRGTHPDQVVLFVHSDVDDDGRLLWSEATLQRQCAQLFPPYLRPARIFLVDAIPYDDEAFKQRKELRYRTQHADLWRNL